MQFHLIDPEASAIRQLEFAINEDVIFENIFNLIGTTTPDTRKFQNGNTFLFFEDQRYSISQLCCQIKGGVNMFIFGRIVIMQLDETRTEKTTQAFLPGNLEEMVEFFSPELSYALKIELKVGLQHEHSPN